MNALTFVAASLVAVSSMMAMAASASSAMPSASGITNAQHHGTAGQTATISPRTIEGTRPLSASAAEQAVVTPVGAIGWINITPAAAWSQRKAPELLSHQGSLWLMGGMDGGRQYHDVWRSDNGAQWSLVTASPPWTERYGFGAVTFNGLMWLMGGYDRNGALRNDVWSSAQGSDWMCAIPAAPWAGRCDLGVVVHADAMWVVGGLRQQPATMCNDVWKSTDGVRWICVAATTPWSPRYSHALASFNGRLYVMGGYDGTPRNDVWSSADGVAWRQETPSAPWSPRFRQRAVVWNTTLMLVGGCQSDAACFNDAWTTMNGVTWTRATDTAEWSRRHSQRIVVHNDAVWLAGGFADGMCFNDVWRYGKGAPPNEPPTITVTPVQQSVVVGETAQATIVCSDPEGTPLAVTAQGLPAGAMLNADNTLLTWTPAACQTGTFVITFTVTDSGTPPLSTSAVATVVVLPPPLAVVTREMPVAMEETPYSTALDASGGMPPYTWAMASGSLPGGIALLPSGVIEGATTATGSFSFAAQVADSAGVVTAQPLVLVVQPLPAGALRIVTMVLPEAARDRPYNTLVLATGGRRPYAWSIFAGTLPPDILLDGQSGLLSGVPRTATNGSFVIQATDADGAKVVKRLALNIVASPGGHRLVGVSGAGFWVGLSPKRFCTRCRDTIWLRMQFAVPDGFVCRSNMSVLVTVGTYAVQADQWIVATNGCHAEWRSARVRSGSQADERITMHVGQMLRSRVCMIHLAIRGADLAGFLGVANATVVNGRILEPVQVVVDDLMTGDTPCVRYDAWENVGARGIYPPQFGH